MNWFIGRTEAMSNPEAARKKVLERLRGLAQLDDPESLVVPILLDAILIAEAYRGDMYHFPRILSGEATPETGYAASLASLERAEAAAESAKTGLPVRL